MKNLYITLALAGLVGCLVGCSKQDENNVPAADVETVGDFLSAPASEKNVPATGTPWQWQERLEPAIEQARHEGKMVFVEFTGSDWCPPCKMLKNEIFPSEKFVDFAKEKFVFVELDFPRMKPQSDETRDYNEKLAEKFSIQAFPTVIIFDGATGFPIAKISGGDRDVDAYLLRFQEQLERGNAILAKITAAREEQDALKRAGMLKEVLNDVDPALIASFAVLEDEIIAADSEDSLGIAAARAARERENAQLQEMRAFGKEINKLFGENIKPGTPEFLEAWKTAKTRIENELKRDDFLPTVRQKYLFNYSVFVAQERDLDALEAVYKEIVSLDANSREGVGAANVLAQFPMIREQMKKAEEAEKAAEGPAAVPVKSEGAENSEGSENSEISENSENSENSDVPAVVPAESTESVPADQNSVPANEPILKPVPANAPVAAAPLHK